MSRAFELAAARPWLMLPDALETLMAVADRQGNPEALEARLGRPLDNTRTVTVRDGVAVIPVVGPIFRYANLLTRISGATSTQELATDFQAALDDPAISRSADGLITVVEHLIDQGLAITRIEVAP